MIAVVCSEGVGHSLRCVFILFRTFYQEGCPRSAWMSHNVQRLLLALPHSCGKDILPNTRQSPHWKMLTGWIHINAMFTCQNRHSSLGSQKSRVEVRPSTGSLAYRLHCSSLPLSPVRFWPSLTASQSEIRRHESSLR